MSKKKTPQEKKQAAYERDHYTFAWHSPHSFPKPWKKKKNHLNRVVRRKSRNLLHEAERPTDGDPVSETDFLTGELFRKGLSRKKLYKAGGVKLREKIAHKVERRESSYSRKGRSRDARNIGFREFVNGVLQDGDYSEEHLLELKSAGRQCHFREFLEDEPHWIPQLRQWIASAQRRIVWRQQKRQRKKPKRH